ncbi:MAG: NAD(P)-binding domain-containing protein [Clostridia bacterium]|nr:NAD(P)-binding domain-containing protein [Clostridia bacterium]
MHLIAVGGDQRMKGILRAARKSGWQCTHILREEELEGLPDRARVVVLPWPKSFASSKVAGSDISREMLLERLPACDVLMGGELSGMDFLLADRVFDPAGDEKLLGLNAKLTAEGAVAALLGSSHDAQIGKVCLITGFGRIAQALAKRLCALEMFVIVCARNEQQMQLAHKMGAHPVPLCRLSEACAQTDVVMNTVPSRIFTGEALAQMKPGARFIELASAPYGADPEQAAQMGVSMEIMGGIPGKYAPDCAGEALFDALLRAMKEEDGKEEA